MAEATALPNPCALVTSAQVTAWLGGGIASVDPQGNRLFRSCKWTGKNMSAPDALPAQRTLMIMVSRSTKAAFLKTARQEPNAIRVNGIGQIAWLAPQGSGGFLNVYSRGYALELDTALLPAPIPVEKAAAKAAVKNL